MMGKVYLSAFGGSGENGRNCYVIEAPDGYILLDCGVKREIADGQVGFYPSLTREIVSQIKAVFLSHCHEDHVAGLPYLYELGYTGKIYATEETIAETTGFVKKWMGYVAKNKGQLPFDEAMADKLVFSPVKLGKQVIEGISVETGRSGHMLGSVWYLFDIAGKKILYTGDMCKEPSVLAFDTPPKCDAAVMNAAYAGKKICQKNQFDTLLHSVKTCVEAGGKVLLPVPPKGRGIEIAQFLGKSLAKTDTKVFVEKAVEGSYRNLAKQDAWIQKGVLSEFPESLHIVASDADREAALKTEGNAVYITPDGMMTTETSLQYFESVKYDEKNKVIITGHAAKGTAGAAVLDDDCRAEQGILASGEKIIFKVHMDDDDIYELCESTETKAAILFHSDEGNTKNIKARLETIGVQGLTLQFPDKTEV